MEKKVIYGGQGDFEAKQVDEGKFKYSKHIVTPKYNTQQHVSFMEVPPKAFAFPYHYHLGITESYVILSGKAEVLTPEGVVSLNAGEVIVFPPGETGAHRLQNASDSEPLRYVDIDTTSVPDVINYPHSKKIAYTAGKISEGCWKISDTVDYYYGEDKTQEDSH
ncbi:MAG: cupin domain-containing protein [Micrococcaceae bacterium]